MFDKFRGLSTLADVAGHESDLPSINHPLRLGLRTPDCRPFVRATQGRRRKVRSTHAWETSEYQRTYRTHYRGTERLQGSHPADHQQCARDHHCRDGCPQGGELSLSRFKVADQAERSGRNPAAGETFEIPTSRSLAFSPGTAVHYQFDGIRSRNFPSSPTARLTTDPTRRRRFQRCARQSAAPAVRSARANR